VAGTVTGVVVGLVTTGGVVVGVVVVGGGEVGGGAVVVCALTIPIFPNNAIIEKIKTIREIYFIL